jgi:uncharacterized protein (DUF58 family)
MPARRLFLTTGMVTLLLVAGLVEARLAWAALGVDGLLLAAFLYDLRRARAMPLTALRRWPTLLVQGAPAEVTVEIAGGRGGAGASVWLREGLSPAVAAAPLRRRLDIDSATPGRWTYRVVPRRRGEARLAPLTARVLGPWRLAWAQRDLLPPETRRVYPQVRWEGRVGQLLALAQRHQLGSVPLAAHGAGTEPYALREYLPGDPPSRLHWKATARHGRLITR